MASIELPSWSGLYFTKHQHHTVPEKLNPSSQTLPSRFVAVITGASRNIGAEIAKSFAQAGATGLILTARSASALDETINKCKALAKSPDLKITAFAMQGGSEPDAKALAAVVEAEHGRLDVLVNNHGIVSTDQSAFSSKFETMTAPQLQEPMNVNYVGKFLTMKYLIPLLQASPNGAKAIINVSSMSSHFATFGAMGFNISAMTENRITEAAADFYGKEGIVAYAVHPGIVGNDRPPPGMPETFLKGPDDPALCGAFCLWLLKEKREWLSGRYVSCNWDVDELESMKDEIVEKDKLKMRLVI